MCHASAAARLGRAHQEYERCHHQHHDHQFAKYVEKGEHRRLALDLAVEHGERCRRGADAAERALVCFPDIFWIAGGRAKEGGIESLAGHFPRVRKVYLIGEAAKDFSRTLEGRVPFEIAGTLDAAVASAYAEAMRSQVAAPVVLLSPACASFDQFRDFEHRGDEFRAAVKRLSSAHLREAS